MPDTQLERVDDVEIFSTGTFDDWTVDDSTLQRMAANFAALSTGEPPLIRCPITIGHAEDGQELPAVGWLADVRVSGDLLMASFVDLEPTVADAIRKKAYQSCSIEAYKEFVAPDGETYLDVVRGCAILGSSQPRVKGLSPIGEPYRYAERGCNVWRFAGRALTFAEPAPTSTRDDDLAWLDERGFDASLVTLSLPSEVIHAIRVMLETGEWIPPAVIHDKARRTFAEPSRKAWQGSDGLWYWEDQQADNSTESIVSAVADAVRQMDFSESTTPERKPMPVTRPRPVVDAQVQIVEQHFEKFSEKYARAGATKEKLVRAYRSMRAIDKSLTAKEFLGERETVDKFAEHRGKTYKEMRPILTELSKRRTGHVSYIRKS